jgi:hypothetical protein
MFEACSPSRQAMKEESRPPEISTQIFASGYAARRFLMESRKIANIWGATSSLRCAASSR